MNELRAFSAAQRGLECMKVNPCMPQRFVPSPFRILSSGIFFPARELGLFHVIDHDWLQTLQFKVDMHRLDDCAQEKRSTNRTSSLSTFSVGRLGSADAQRRFLFALQNKHWAGIRNGVITYNRRRAATITFFRTEEGNTLCDFSTYVMRDK
jgi:hypothetical protein